MTAMSLFKSKTAAKALAASCGYHSGADAQRMALLIQSMLQDRRPLVLSSPHRATLEHYSRLMVRDLRQNPAIRILDHEPQGTDSLLERLNSLLDSLQVDQVVNRRALPSGPVQVFMLHDSASLSQEELALLARLINDLPGANLRMVLIAGRLSEIPARMKALGTQTVYWNIQTPAEPGPVEPDLGEDLPATRRELENAFKEALREAPEPVGVRRPARTASQPAAPAPPIPARASARRLMDPLKPDRIESVLARHQKSIVAGGLITSALIAMAMGLWLSSQTPHKASARGAALSQSAK